MTYYHETAEAAREAAKKYEEHFTVYVVLEPYNGHVIKLVPKSKEVFKYPVYEIMQEAELCLPSILTIRPEGKKKPKPVVAKPKAPPRAAVPPPPPPGMAKPKAAMPPVPPPPPPPVPGA